MSEGLERKEKERLLRERRRQRILAGSSSRLGLITGATTVAKGGEGHVASPQAASSASAPQTVVEEQLPRPTDDRVGREGEDRSIPEVKGGPATNTQSKAEGGDWATGTRREEEEEDGGHGTYTGTLTFEDGVELPSPSSLLATDGSSFASAALPHLTTTAAKKAPPSLARVSGVVSIITLAVVLGCAFLLSSLPSMRDSTLARLFGSDEPQAWLNIHTSSIMMPFLTLEASLALVSFLSNRLAGPQTEAPVAGGGGGGWHFSFSLPFGRVFTDISLFLFSFVVTVDLLSLAWPWLAAA